MKKLPFFILLIAVLTSSPASAQKKSFRNIHFSQHDFVDTVKIKVWDGAVIIPVEINGEVKNLMFDAGANWGFWIGHEEEWMRPAGDSLTVYDSQKAKKKMAVFRMPPMKMGNTTIENYPLVVDNALADMVCDRIDGAFGFDLVTCGLSFKFDTKDSLMIVTDRKGFFSKEEKHQPKLKYEPYKSYYMVSPLVWVNFPWGRAKMTFDLGCIGGWVDIPEPFLKRWSKDKPKIQQGIADYTVEVDTSITLSAGLFGRSEDTMLYRRLHFPEITMGDLALQDLWISTNSRMIKTGSAVLERASLIIDGPKKCFVFFPHDGKREIAVGNENKRGVSHTFAGKSDTLGAVKAVVRKGSEAYQKGIRTGDYLISFNGVPITDYCTYFNLDTDVEVKHCVYRSPEGEIKEVVW
jgi:hypothetical protein